MGADENDPTLTARSELTDGQKRVMRWSNFGDSANLAAVLVAVGSVAAVIAGVWMLLIGATEGDTGGYGGVSYTIVWRPYGAVLIALGLIVGPAGAVVARALALYAAAQNEK